MWNSPLAPLLCKLFHLDFSFQTCFWLMFHWSNWYGKLTMGPRWAPQTWCSTCRSWLLPSSLTPKLRREQDSDAFRRRYSQRSSSAISSLFHFTTLILFICFGPAWEKVYFAQSYDCLLLTGLEHMTVPLSYIIPRVCLWIYFGIVSVKHLVKVLFFSVCF